MLHFTLDMPFALMALYGSLMIALLCLLRLLLKNRLPKFVFPVLWMAVLVRLLVPFSVSSPLSAPVPNWLLRSGQSVTAVAAAGTATEDARTGTGVAAQTAMTGTREAAVQAGASAGGTVTDIGSDTGRSAFYSAGHATTEEAAANGTVLDYTSFEGYAPNWLFLLYCLGAVVTAGMLLRQKLLCTGRLKNSLLLEQNETVNRLIYELELKRVQVFTNDEIATPLVCGLWNVRIYLPAGMEFQNIGLLRDILTHEVMHVRRRDNWLKAVMLFVLCLHWFNPLVWLMSRLFSSDLEAACDAAVLRRLGEDCRQGYAGSLLEMAVSGGRSSLLYSAFSKSEVERRIRNVLGYRRLTALMLTLSLLLVVGGTAVLATGGAAPFDPALTGYCVRSDSRWGARVELTRGVALGKNAQERAETILLNCLKEKRAADKDSVQAEILSELSREFGVEKTAFRADVGLSLTQEQEAQERADWNITQRADGRLLFEGKLVRVYVDKMAGSWQTWSDGEVVVTVQRDRMGNIVDMEVEEK